MEVTLKIKSRMLTADLDDKIKTNNQKDVTTVICVVGVYYHAISVNFCTTYSYPLTMKRKTNTSQ